MTVCGTAFFMKSVKASTPTIAIVLTKLTYIAILYSANCILLQQVCEKSLFNFRPGCIVDGDFLLPDEIDS